MNVFGAEVFYQMEVTEPEPGRVLVEENEKAGVATAFSLEPVNGDRQTCVTIRTKAKTSPGLKGIMEKLLNPMITRKIYREELALLAGIVERETV